MKIQNKRAQSAVEYLMTYGWAILVIIVVGAALWKLGVFDVSKYTGSAKLTIAGFTVSGSQLTTTQFKAKIGTQETITVNNFTVTVVAPTGPVTVSSDLVSSGCGNNANGTVWSPNSEKDVTCGTLSGLTAGNSYSTTVTIVYLDSASYAHTVSGTYNAKTE